MSGRDIFLRLLSVFLLIAINAFFVTTEFAIVSVRRSRINHLVLEGDVAAKTVQSLQRSLDRLLSTTQLGITLSSLALGWIGEGTMAVLFRQVIIDFPLLPGITQAIAHSFSIPIAFFSIAYLQIVLGELCPKSIALMYSEQLARFLAAPSLVIGRIFNPFIWILNKSTHFLVKLFGIEYAGQGWYKQVTPEELQLIINTEKESSGLEAEERELLNNIFEFGDVEAEEIMTPRLNIKALPLDATCQNLLEEVAKTRHSCYPIIGDSLDDIKGIVDFKDLAFGLAEKTITLETSISQLIKPVRFLAESTFLSELLSLMQRSRLKMVIIVDEYGGTSGLVTIQDLVNEIIGGDHGNHSDSQSLIKIINEQTFIISAQINVEELNELLELNLPLTDEYQTLGGFLLYQWQKIPKQGEILHFDNLELTVYKVEGTRLVEIKIYRHQPNPQQVNQKEPN
jgi:CBS domain containing-hemolysin-like protein